jgi:hypothetical protein
LQQSPSTNANFDTGQRANIRRPEAAFSSSTRKLVRRLKEHLPPRTESYVRSVPVHGHLTTRFLSKIGRKGGENSRVNLSKRLRKQLAREAANARWKKGAT